MNNIEQTTTAETENQTVSSDNVETTLDEQITQQNTLTVHLIDTCKNATLLMKRFGTTTKETNAKLIEESNILAEKIHELDLYIYALEKIPSAVEEKINQVAPKIGEQIALKHTKYLEEFKHYIDDCHNSLKLVKAEVEAFQKWGHKKTITIVSIAAVIAMLASTCTTFFILKKNPQKEETRIWKANNVHADGVVHIFDMTGKFCAKAIMPSEKK